MAKTYILTVPTDTEIQSAIGRLAITHSHFEYIIKMLFKTVNGWSLHEALDKTKMKGVGKVRTAVEKAAKGKLGQKELKLIENWLSEARQLSEDRNTYVHGLWIIQEGKPIILFDEARNKTIVNPNAEDIDALTRKIIVLMKTVNSSRLKGWLIVALKNTENISV